MTRNMAGFEIALRLDKSSGMVSSVSIHEAGEFTTFFYQPACSPFYSTSQRAKVYPLVGLHNNAFVIKVSAPGSNAVSGEFSRIPQNFQYRYKLKGEVMVSRFAGAYNLSQFFELGRDMSALRARVGFGLSGAIRLLNVLRGAAFELKEVHKVGVVHHDIKPSNFVVDDKDKVTLIDWELAVKEGARYSLISVSQQKKIAEKKQAYDHCGPERFQKTLSDPAAGVARCADDMFGFAEMIEKALNYIKIEPSCAELYRNTYCLLSNLVLMCRSTDLEERPTAKQLYDSLSMVQKECSASVSKPIAIPVPSKQRAHSHLARRKIPSAIAGKKLPVSLGEEVNIQDGLLGSRDTFFSLPVGSSDSAGLALSRSRSDSLYLSDSLSSLGSSKASSPVRSQSFSKLTM